MHSRFFKHRYVIAIAAIIGAFAAKAMIAAVVPFESPFIFLFTAVVVAAWIGGLRTGIFATVVAALASSFLWYQANNYGTYALLDPIHLRDLTVFIVEGLFVSALFHTLHSSRRSLATAVKEAQEARKLAEVSDKAKKDFISNMSHEIRTPLTAILGFTELIMKPDLPESERQRYVPKVQANVRALSMLIDDILEISAIERGGLEIEKKSFGVLSFLREVEQKMQPIARQKGVALEFRTKGFLPLEIESDVRKLNQILSHVISNTIKTAQGDQVSVVATLRKRTRFHSGNNGVQSPGASLAFIIRSEPSREASERLGRATSCGTATIQTAEDVGLEFGLPLAKRLAQALGGDIKAVKVRPDSGSTYLITLPIEFAPDFVSSLNEVILRTASTEAPPQEANQDLDGEPLKGIKVLLVEDSPDNRFLVSRFLDMAGAEVETAKDGREGVDKATHGDYNVVVMDIQMPVLDGNHAAQELRARRFDQPLIALSAHAMQEDQETATQSGFNDYLVKPVNRKDLIEKVKRYASMNQAGHPPLLH